MQKTQTQQTNRKITVDTQGLQQLLGCGKHSALAIGDAAGARLRIGRRTLWSLTKVESYVMQQSGQEV